MYVQCGTVVDIVFMLCSHVHVLSDYCLLIIIIYDLFIDLFMYTVLQSNQLSTVPTLISKYTPLSPS